jgi:hypothetical protein
LSLFRRLLSRIINGLEASFWRGVLAWQCLKKDLIPAAADKDTVLREFPTADGIGHLNYLEQKLSLIQTIGSAEDRVRFLLDPLAEYLGALELIKDCELAKRNGASFSLLRTSVFKKEARSLNF